MRPGRSHRRARYLIGGVIAIAGLAALTGCDLQENADTDRGEQLFTQKCGNCHALTAAGTSSEIGPDLDIAFADSRASGMDQDTIEGVVEGQIANPRPAAEDSPTYMPANLVEGEDASDVAAYIASVAGVPGIKPPEFVAPEFFATNCGGCHTLGAAGTTGQTGPDLDQTLSGQAPDEISMSITDPNAKPTPGFPLDRMPDNYEETLQPKDLQELVQFLIESVGGGGGGK